MDSEMYIIAVIIDTSMNNLVVGSASLFMEQKFIHNLGKAGHIEDVVVRNSHRGQKLGKFLIDYLCQNGLKKGCYKIILDCEEEKVGFYEKCGLKRKGAQMAIYF